jgi:TolB-like protein
MKSMTVAVIAVLSAAACAQAGGFTPPVVAQDPPAAQADDRPGIGVFPFDNGGSISIESDNLDNLRVGLQNMLMTELSQSTDLRLVDRAQLNALLQEQDLYASGRVSAETAARIGKLVGARYSILGAFTQLGPFRVDARIVDTETGEIIQARSVQGEIDETYENLVTLAASLVEDVNLEGLNVTPVPEAQTEQRRRRTVPGAALVLYARATAAIDAGDIEAGRETLELLASRFPDYTEAQDELRQLSPGER